MDAHISVLARVELSISAVQRDMDFDATRNLGEVARAAVRRWYERELAGRSRQDLGDSSIILDRPGGVDRDINRLADFDGVNGGFVDERRDAQVIEVSDVGQRLGGADDLTLLAIDAEGGGTHRGQNIK